MRSSSLSPDRRARLVPLPGRSNVKALVPPPCPRSLDVTKVFPQLIAAERAMSGLAAITRHLPRPDLITRSLERREAVLSSQIEGTQTDVAQLPEYEATGSGQGLPDDVGVTLGYSRALQFGLHAVRGVGGAGNLTLDLLQALHRVLLEGSGYPHPEGAGAWRRMQNWVGGHRIEDAILVPPPETHLPACLADLEQFLQSGADEGSRMALSVRIAVAHVQFEAIHPFSDGNGRVGRLLPPLMLAAEGFPPLYLAGFLKTHRRRYFDTLGGVQRNGRWTPWLAFMLEAISAAAAEEQATGEKLIGVRLDWDRRTAHLRRDSAARRMLDLFLGAPVQTIGSAGSALGLSGQAANGGMAALLQLRIVQEASGRHWRRSFHAREVLDILS